MNILITNLHSALNLGDDAIFEAMLLEIQRNFPDARIKIAANDPDSWRKYTSKVEVLSSMVTWVKRWKDGQWELKKVLVFYYFMMLLLGLLAHKIHKKIYFGTKEVRKLLEAYYNCDMVLACGGGNIYSRKLISWGLLWELLMFGFAGLLGKPVYLLPQSIGPIHGQFQKIFTRFFLNKTRNIYVRDQVSEDLLISLRVKTPYRIVPDLAFSLRRYSTPQNPQGKVKIGITVINLFGALSPTVSQEKFEGALLEILKDLNNRYAAQFTLIVQCYGPTMDQDDRIVSTRLFQRLKAEIPDLNLADKLESGRAVHDLISTMDLLIGTRMHSGIFSLGACVPTILFGYQPKSFALMQMFGLDKYCVPMATFSRDQVLPLASELLDNGPSIKIQLEAEMNNIMQKQEDWFTSLIN